MKEYHVTIMSTDGTEDPDDNHQKYGLTVEAENEKQAIEKGTQKFHSEYGEYQYPIFWSKATQTA